MEHIEAPSIPRRPNDWLKPEEDTALLEANGIPTEEMIVWLLRWTGLRVSEASNLRFSDIDLTPGDAWITVTKSKTAAGVRRVPVTPELAVRLRGRAVRQAGQRKG